MHVFFFYSFLQARKAFQKKIHPITSVMRWKATPWTIFTFENSRLYMIFFFFIFNQTLKKLKIL